MLCCSTAEVLRGLVEKDLIWLILLAVNPGENFPDHQSLCLCLLGAGEPQPARQDRGVPGRRVGGAAEFGGAV